MCMSQEIAVVARLEKDRCSIYVDQLCMQAVHVNSQTEQGSVKGRRVCSGGSSRLGRGWLKGDEFAVVAVAVIVR